jgi:hypothetical protein
MFFRILKHRRQNPRFARMASVVQGIPNDPSVSGEALCLEMQIARQTEQPRVMPPVYR